MPLFHFMKVKADVLLRKSYKIQRFNCKLNNGVLVQCRIACFIGFVFFFMLYSPAVDDLQSCSFLERIPVGKRHCVQNVPLIQTKEFVYFSNYVLYSPPPLHQWPVFS